MFKALKIRSISKFTLTVAAIFILFLIFLIIIVSTRKQSQNEEKYLTNPENVISPVIRPEAGYENMEYSDYFKRLSNEPILIFENYIFNWQNIFDIFASNTANISLKYDISKNSLEKLSYKIKKTQQEFYKGSSDEIMAQYGNVIKEEATYYKLDWRLILSIIKQESDFSSTAKSRAGAYGFMQIMPRTGSALEETLNLEDHTSPINNFVAGIYYYALLTARYDEAGIPNKYEFALAAYNCGSGHVEDAMSIAYHYGQDYLKWENVSEGLKKLGPNYDTLHTKIWNSRPPNGIFTNWIEPVNYVFNIMYYWEQYKKIYPIPDDKQQANKKRKKK